MKKIFWLIPFFLILFSFIWFFNNLQDSLEYDYERNAVLSANNELSHQQLLNDHLDTQGFYIPSKLVYSDRFEPSGFVAFLNSENSSVNVRVVFESSWPVLYAKEEQIIDFNESFEFPFVINTDSELLNDTVTANIFVDDELYYSENIHITFLNAAEPRGSAFQVFLPNRY